MSSCRAKDAEKLASNEMFVIYNRNGDDGEYQPYQILLDEETHRGNKSLKEKPLKISFQ